MKQYFDGKKFQPMEPSVKQTADALGIGVATVKRIMADYNRDPKSLDEPCRLRGRPAHAVSVTHQEAVRAYVNKNHSKVFIWCSGEDDPWVQKPTGKGERLIIINAITKAGWVSGAKLVFKSTKKNRGLSWANELGFIPKMVRRNAS